jgi:hypothetical protein
LQPTCHHPGQHCKKSDQCQFARVGDRHNPKYSDQVTRQRQAVKAGWGGFYGLAGKPQVQGKGGEDGQPPAPIVLQKNAEIGAFDISDPIAASYHIRVLDHIPDGHHQPANGRHAQNPLPMHPMDGTSRFAITKDG